MCSVCNKRCSSATNLQEHRKVSEMRVDPQQVLPLLRCKAIGCGHQRAAALQTIRQPFSCSKTEKTTVFVIWCIYFHSRSKSKLKLKQLCVSVSHCYSLHFWYLLLFYFSAKFHFKYISNPFCPSLLQDYLINYMNDNHVLFVLVQKLISMPIR